MIKEKAQTIQRIEDVTMRCYRECALMYAGLFEGSKIAAQIMSSDTDASLYVTVDYKPVDNADVKMFYVPLRHRDSLVAAASGTLEDAAPEYDFDTFAENMKRELINAARQ